MNKKILFSPIGGTDPISNMRDGSMLHICRVYKPDIVYLYLSKEMNDRHEDDNRYCTCIKKLGELLNHEFDVKLIINEKLIGVHEFDIFYELFSKEIIKIRKSIDDTDTLYVNVSSGTPAMKSSLFLIAAISDYKFIPIQVATPQKGINSNKGKKEESYNLEQYWKDNKDNIADEFENRSTEVSSIQLFRILKKDLIKKHLDSYDYNAAYATFETIKSTKKNQEIRLAAFDEEDIRESEDEINSVYIEKLLKMAVCRSNLDISGTNKIMRELNVDIIPIKNGEYIKVFEYSMVVWLKLKRKEYADYARSLTPLLWQMYVMILKKQFSLDIFKLTKKEKNGYRWDEKKLKENREIYDILNKRYRGRFKAGEVNNSNLNAIVSGMASRKNDEKLKDEIDVMKDVELSVRNMVAHTITMITDEIIKKKIGHNAEQIFEKLRYLVEVAGVPVKKEGWNTYDDMNDFIKKELDNIF